LGDERFGLVAKESLGKLRVTLAMVVFQRGRYWGGITVLGESRISSRSVIRYARLLDGKVSGAAGAACG
jgi:hypothetical protein